MELLTEKTVKDFINAILRDKEIVGIHKFAEDSNYQWAVVFGWLNDGCDKGLVIKTAYCPRNCGLTADYDSWNCPRYKDSGEDDDTEVFYEEGEDLVDRVLAELSFWNSDISRFMDEYVNKYAE